VAGRIRSIDKSSERIENQTRDFPACSIVHEQITLPRASFRIATFAVVFPPSHLRSTQGMDYKRTDGVITLYGPLGH
jgi:hypothetical protein